MEFAMDIRSLTFLPPPWSGRGARRPAAGRGRGEVAAAKTESRAVALLFNTHYSRTATRETLDLPVRVSIGYRAATTSGIVNEVSGFIPGMSAEMKTESAGGRRASIALELKIRKHKQTGE